MTARLSPAYPARALGHREWSAIVPAVVLIVGLLAYWLIYVRYRTDMPIRSDGEGYYAYLPAYLVHLDPSFWSIVDGHFRTAYPTLKCATCAFGMVHWPNGNWQDKYGVGEALLLLPFFGLGHGIAIASGAVANGYSAPEEYVVGAGALVYVVLGLYAIRAALRRWFPDAVVAFTLLGITFATGVFSYATYDSMFSHAFEFFAVALTLLCALRWYDQPRSWWRAVTLGLAAGLVVAIRLDDSVLLLAVPLLGVGSRAALRNRAVLVWHDLDRVGAVLAGAALPLLVQATTWFLSTGHWVINPYPGQEQFDLAHPQLVQSLLWFEPHGLLPYAPIFIVPLVGMLVALVVRRDIGVPVVAAFLPFWYLISSWWDWSFSAGFGNRAFIDITPLLALPLCWVLASVWHSRWRLAVPGLVLVCAYVTCALMIAYWQFRISGQGIDPAGYFTILAHPHGLVQPPCTAQQIAGAASGC